MQVDHIFIFTATPAQAAAELVALGLLEGSSRVHGGQGTANRKFYFPNFFLELLWVCDAAELVSPAVAATGLGQHASGRAGVSPYGLGLAHTPDSDALFAAALAYQPAYFPPGWVVDVFPPTANQRLPWTFRLPRQVPRGQPYAQEPTQHPAGLRQFTRATFGLAFDEATEPLVQGLAAADQLRFVPATQPTLELTFDNHRQKRTVALRALPLTLAF